MPDTSMSVAEEKAVPVIRPFAAWLHDQRNGALNVELGEALVELVDAVTTTGKAGTLTLTLALKPVGRGDVSTLTVKDKITVKAPQGERGETLFFADAAGNLVRNNPIQPELERLREVPRPDAAEVREVAR